MRVSMRLEDLVVVMSNLLVFKKIGAKKSHWISGMTYLWVQEHSETSVSLRGTRDKQLLAPQDSCSLCLEAFCLLSWSDEPTGPSTGFSNAVSFWVTPFSNLHHHSGEETLRSFLHVQGASWR